MSESPLSRAEDAKRNRDLGAEIGILTSAGVDLESQPWYPLRPGDVVLMSTADGAIGETYLGVDDGFETALSCTSSTEDTVSEAPIPLHDLWFEAEPSTLVVIRAGRVVFGKPRYKTLAGG